MKEDKEGKSTRSLGNKKEWDLLVNDDRVLVRGMPGQEKSAWSWSVLSSAVLNGGLKVFSNDQPLQILNVRVAADYDGKSPNPQELLRQLANEEVPSVATENATTIETIGLLTAASMKSLRISSQQATDRACNQTIIVDAIVTAGISNSRAAGAKADVFSFLMPSEHETNGTSDADKEPNKKFGTINTIIITNAVLDDSSIAMVEAYAVAIEAKCKAVADLGILCCKDPSERATGTGTDSTVLVCKQATNDCILYAGKHTLFGELIGQAVYQATKEAIESNLHKLYKDYPVSPALCYQLRCCKLQILQAFQEGHRPLVPARPMKPIPTPRPWVLMVGLLGIVLCFSFHVYALRYTGQCQSNVFVTQPSISVLLAIFWGDRFLGSVMMPLCIHPVVLVGKLISKLLSGIPELCFLPENPLLGLSTGVLLYLITVAVSVIMAWVAMVSPNICLHGGYASCCSNDFVRQVASWSLQVFLVRGSLSLQLLCNVALQMAHFLERHQIQQARAQLSWLCSRDSSTLRADELAGSTLESLSENLSDSVVSPLFFYVLFGPIGAFSFRVMNTLDSRVGYRGKFEWIGKPSARCDDLLNLLPARLTSLLLVLAAALLNISHGSCKPMAVVYEGMSVAWRDARQCDSPNAGWPMATFAGILGVRLEKRGQYSLNGPQNGGDGKLPSHHDIRNGVKIATLAGMLAFLLAIVSSGIVNAIR